MGIFRLERLHDERAELECPIRASRFELGPYRRALRPETRELLGKVISRTRQSLRRRLVERLTCEAFEERERRGYRFTGLIRPGSCPPASPQLKW